MNTQSTHDNGTQASGRPRMVAYAQEGIVDERGDHMVALVTENEAGYSPSTYTGDLTYCEEVAANINACRGYSRREVLDVVASSFRAQQQMEDFLEGSGRLPSNGARR